MTTWRVEQKCANCPFHKAGPGRVLRDSLRPGRWSSILRDLLAGNGFVCHKTVEYDDEGEAVHGTGLLCAGAIEWQNRRGTSSQLQRVCERLRAYASKAKGQANAREVPVR